MSAKLLRGIALILLLAAVGLAVVAFLFVGSDEAPDPVRMADKAEPPAEAVEVVVARRELAPFVALEAADLNVVTMPRPDADFAQSKDALIGRMTQTAIAKDALVAPSALIAFSELAKRVAPGMQAVSISVNETVAVGGLAAPGDLVDVLIYLRASGSRVKQSQAAVLLSDVRLLALGGRLASQNDENESAERNRSRQTTAVLAVPKPLVPRLLLGDEAGDLRLALIGESDATQAALAALNASSDAAKTEKPVALKLDALIEASDESSQAKPTRPARPRRPAPRRTIEVYRGNQSTSVSAP